MGRPDVLELPHARSLNVLSVRAGFLAPGSSPRLRPSPGFPEWRRIVRLKGGGLAGYSGGTAQVFDLLPFYPPEAGGTLTLGSGV